MNGGVEIPLHGFAHDQAIGRAWPSDDRHLRGHAEPVEKYSPKQAGHAAVAIQKRMKLDESAHSGADPNANHLQPLII